MSIPQSFHALCTRLRSDAETRPQSLTQGRRPDHVIYRKLPPPSIPRNRDRTTQKQPQQREELQQSASMRAGYHWNKSSNTITTQAPQARTRSLSLTTRLILGLQPGWWIHQRDLLLQLFRRLPPPWQAPGYSTDARTPRSSQPLDLRDSTHTESLARLSSTIAHDSRQLRLMFSHRTEPQLKNWSVFPV